MKATFAVGYEEQSQMVKAEALAKTLHLQVDNLAQNKLLVSPQGLMLKLKGFKPLAANFSLARWQARRLAGKKQGLVKACKPAKGLRIIDATAGWGRDAAILATFGAEVIMLEQNPLMGLLLQDALERRDELAKRELNLSLHRVEACCFLKNLPLLQYPDVIYIDPMHPARQKKALVKKELQALQQFIAPDDKATVQLLLLAQNRVKNRVVVKWPLSLAPLLKPHASIGGKTVRFDIYQPLSTI